MMMKNLAGCRNGSFTHHLDVDMRSHFVHNVDMERTAGKVGSLVLAAALDILERAVASDNHLLLVADVSSVLSVSQSPVLQVKKNEFIVNIFIRRVLYLY